APRSETAQADGTAWALGGGVVLLSRPLQPERGIAFLGGAHIERLAVGKALAFAGIDRRAGAVGGAVTGDRAGFADFDHFRLYDRVRGILHGLLRCRSRILGRLGRLLVEIVDLGLLLLELGIEVGDGVVPPAGRAIEEAALFRRRRLGLRRVGARGRWRLALRRRLLRAGRCRRRGGGGGRWRRAALRQRGKGIASEQRHREQSAADTL